MGYFVTLSWAVRIFPPFSALSDIFNDILPQTGSGVTLGVFNPQHMPSAINSEVTLQGAVATGCTILEVVPSFLEVRGSEKGPE